MLHLLSNGLRVDLWSICISTTQNARSAAMTSAPLVPITATTVKHNTNATNVDLSGMNKGNFMKIQTFINELKLTFVYALLRQTLTDEQLFEHSVQDGQVTWFKEQMRQMWHLWTTAAAEEVPDGFALVKVAKAQAVPNAQQALHDRLLVKSIREHVEGHISEISVNDLFDKGWLAAMKCIQNNIDMLEAQEPTND